MTSVDPEQLHEAAKELRGLIGNASSVAETAAAHDMSWDIWGLPGIFFAKSYGDSSDEFKQYLAQGADGLNNQASKLDGAANGWEEADLEISRAFDDLLSDGFETQGRWDRFGQTTGDSGAGSFFNTPSAGIISNAMNVVSSVDSVRSANSPTEAASDIASALAGVHAFASGAATFIMDPIKYLVGAGLDFLITLIQPLNDILGAVTGNPGKMQDEIDKWDRVRTGLEPISNGVIDSWDQHLTDWEGADGEAAFDSTCKFSEAIIGLGSITYDLQGILQAAQAMADAIRGVIYDIIGGWVSKNIAKWIIALALAAFTMGGSTATAMVFSKITAVVAFLQGLQRKMEAIKVFKAFADIVGKINKIMGPMGEYIIQWQINSVGAVATGLTHEGTPRNQLDEGLAYE
ncbi:hypothetical protein [Natronoglycomyces albus]|uniref:WXG100 family type VII secretion target n=1 Tax=Natronoglycomyces albus TaxID=2811108 RepID=A0A895XK79_9ACTN|nr:hypothetical protein [Natronoglycomyces albus]QSB05744.1 hypothetical protein JQS30_02100 [Natronoglycomyces albus]